MRLRPGPVAASLLVFAFALLFLATASAPVNNQSNITGAPPGWTPPTTQPAVVPAVTAVDQLEVAAPTDEAVWENGELLAPLPRDPRRRAEALAQAEANALSRNAAQPGVPHTMGAPGGVQTAALALSTASPGTTPASASSRDANINLKLPDTFTLPREAVLGVDRNGAPLSQAQQDESAQAALATSLKQSFEGIGQTALTPPDCDIAVGPTAVMVVVNASLAIYSKCGTQLFMSDIKAWIGDASTSLYFDPKVIYDTYSDRWFVLYLIKNSTTHASSAILMYSDDSDPVGIWNYTFVDMTLNGGSPTSYWADYPDLGADPYAVYITVNMFNWSSPAVFQYAKIRSLDKAEVLNGGGVCWWDNWDLHNPADNSLAFSLRACKMGSWPGDMWFVNSVSYGGNFLTLWKLTGTTVCSGPALASYNLSVLAYDNPDAMLQPNGTYLDCDDARLLNASYYLGNIWTGHARRINWGEATDRSAVEILRLQPYALTVSFQQALGATGLYYAYPAVDFDTSDHGVVTFSRGGPGENPGSRYADVSSTGSFSVSSLLVSGSSSYTGSPNAGTLADPYRWGDYYGCDRDPFDNRTLWMYGEYTLNTTTWATRIGAVAPLGDGALSVAPSPGLVAGGLQGGPFTPTGVAYTLSNAGNSAVWWSLSGVDSWNTASATSGQLAQGQSVVVNVDINAGANAFSQGVYTDTYTFFECYSGLNYSRQTTLHVGISGLACNSSMMDLVPDGPPDYDGADVGDHERGVFITSMKYFSVCSIGYHMKVNSLPRQLIARIYAASGTTRGALLASASFTQTELTETMHYVPINYTLEPCKDYEIVMVIPAGDGWHWWDERNLAEPFDVGGVIRVRDGAIDGSASNYALPHFQLVGSTATGSEAVFTDLGGPGSPPNTANDVDQQRGIYVHALDTGMLYKFGWNADLPVGEVLTARIYAASGTTRGNLLATGTYKVASSGLRFHDVPVNVQIEEGRDYDLTITFGHTNSWPWWNENLITEPYTKDMFSVVSAESDGSASNFALPHYRAKWESKTGGEPFDLRKITDSMTPPNSTNQPNSDYGAYITSVISQQVYALGWMADLPAGAPITANVYEATGTARGALISSGTIYSSASGMRWHDVPIAAEFVAGHDYDISISWSSVNQWRWWSDLSGMPYTINGVIQVRNSEAFGGGASNSALINMRVFACNATLTPVIEKEPQRTPMFIAVPTPNPVTGTSRLNFALESEGAVTIHIYDVAGRRVSTVLDGHRPAGWQSVDLKSEAMPSGVYFLKMQTATKSLSRKFVVMH